MHVEIGNKPCSLISGNTQIGFSLQRASPTPFCLHREVPSPIHLYVLDRVYSGVKGVKRADSKLPGLEQQPRSSLLGAAIRGIRAIQTVIIPITVYSSVTMIAYTDRDSFEKSHPPTLLLVYPL